MEQNDLNHGIAASSLGWRFSDYAIQVPKIVPQTGAAETYTVCVPKIKNPVFTLVRQNRVGTQGNLDPGGVLIEKEIETFPAHGVSRIYTPEDGRTIGLQGIIDDMLNGPTSIWLKRSPQSMPK